MKSSPKIQKIIPYAQARERRPCSNCDVIFRLLKIKSLKKGTKISKLAT